MENARPSGPGTEMRGGGAARCGGGGAARLTSSSPAHDLTVPVCTQTVFSIPTHAVFSCSPYKPCLQPQGCLVVRAGRHGLAFAPPPPPNVPPAARALERAWTRAERRGSQPDTN